MKHLFTSTALVLATLALPASAATTISLQRFFGACDADYGSNTDVAKAVGECGIITSLINEFQAKNPDIHVDVTTVEWPGYDQLNAQLAARNAPDVVSMHYSAISDYQSRNLLLPVDDLLAEAGLKPADFTDAARAGVTKDGKMYGLPFDNWTLLFHVNMNLMQQAGLVGDDGKPVLPHSVAELLAQGHQFVEKTGKPYLVQALANETANYARLFYTFMQQQDVDVFADPKKIDLTSPAARAVVQMMKDIHDQGLSTVNMDYTAMTAAFAHGDGGIAINGTWLIGDYEAQAEKPGNPLSGGYEVYPVPQLFPGKDSTYVDGHSWVLPAKKHSKAELAAISKLYGFLAANDGQWARTGHVPAVRAVYDDPAFQALPHRDDIAPIAKIGETLPPQVMRQFPIQDILGEELGAAVNGDKSIEDALSAAQSRINDLLANI